MKAGIISLGCAKNLVDTENMLGLLKYAGIEITTDRNEADVIIVNTCGLLNLQNQKPLKPFWMWRI